MSYNVKGEPKCDHVQFGKGMCLKNAPNEIATKNGPNLHYCNNHAKQALNKKFKR